MKRITASITGFILAMLPIAANAIGDPFLGTWRLSKAKSVIATDPGVKSKEFVFTSNAGGVLITETLEMLSENGEKHISHIPFSYGKITPQPGPGIDNLLVIKTDSNTVYWTAQSKGRVVAQLQVNLASDGKLMTFRYLWSAADPEGRSLSDRYVYEKL